MPKAFDDCAAASGSRIRTKALTGGKYIHICIPKSGKSVGGHVKVKQR